ncbi:hypothetical protein V1520DRAFT_370961 [Lipomyces starkeyi]
MDQFRVDKSNVSVLAIGQQFANDCKAGSYVQQYAISNHFAVKNGWVKNKNNTFLLVCKCSGKVRNTRNLPAVVGTHGENDKTRIQEARMGNHRVRGHQLEGINPFAYAENRSLSEQSKQAMVALVRDSSATHAQIADMVNVTYGTQILARDVYNRTYNHNEEKGKSTARYIETLGKEGMVYRMLRIRQIVFVCRLSTL